MANFEELEERFKGWGSW